MRLVPVEKLKPSLFKLFGPAGTRITSDSLRMPNLIEHTQGFRLEDRVIVMLC